MVNDSIVHDSFGLREICRSNQSGNCAGFPEKARDQNYTYVGKQLDANVFFECDCEWKVGNGECDERVRDGEWCMQRDVAWRETARRVWKCLR